VMTAVVTHILVLGRGPELDNQGRPREFYGRRVLFAVSIAPLQEIGMEL
jgi:Ni,Fe-hydrogenase I small subunit